MTVSLFINKYIYIYLVTVVPRLALRSRWKFQPTTCSPTHDRVRFWIARTPLGIFELRAGCGIPCLYPITSLLWSIWLYGSSCWHRITSLVVEPRIYSWAFDQSVHNRTDDPTGPTRQRGLTRRDQRGPGLALGSGAALDALPAEAAKPSRAAQVSDHDDHLCAWVGIFKDVQVMICFCFIFSPVVFVFAWLL